VRSPLDRIGQQLIDAAGFQFHEEQTAARRVERLGFCPADVRCVVLTHADPDHTGGLADFPHAQIHLSAEEHAAVAAGSWRYLPAHFAYGPNWKPCAGPEVEWFGLRARRLDPELASDVLLVPLFGHTLGHCGVAVGQDGRWVLHVGDAYDLRVELDRDDHPVSGLAAQRADDNTQRLASLEHLRRLTRDHAGEVEVFGYHDFSEFPPPA
jgi:glyoxylase-like metal-dependent hydrolase (beta-lactamase superfamily II)